MTAKSEQGKGVPTPEEMAAQWMLDVDWQGYPPSDLAVGAYAYGVRGERDRLQPVVDAAKRAVDEGLHADECAWTKLPMSLEPGEAGLRWTDPISEHVCDCWLSEVRKALKDAGFELPAESQS